MSSKHDLAVTVSEFVSFGNTLVEKSGGALVSSDGGIDITNYTTAFCCYLNGCPNVKIEGVYRLVDDKFADPRLYLLENRQSGYVKMPLIGSNGNTRGFAWNIISFDSGDTIVKFAQSVSDNKLDILPESFQSWGIAAYNKDGFGADALNTRNLGEDDLLAGASYGGFMVHPMIKGDYGITVFSHDTKSPIFTWTKDSQSIVYEVFDDLTQEYIYKDATNGDGLPTYVEKERLLGDAAATKAGQGSDADIYGYDLWCSEPADTPKYPMCAALAPIVCPGTTDNYAKTARFLVQSPHLYNPFDGSGYICITDGGKKKKSKVYSAYYCDFGVCACATGMSLSPSGGFKPDIPIYRPVDVGDNKMQPDSTTNPDGYKKYFIEF